MLSPYDTRLLVPCAVSLCLFVERMELRKLPMQGPKIMVRRG